MTDYNQNNNERSVRKFMTVASIVEIVKTIAYAISTIILLVVGGIVFHNTQTGEQVADFGTAIAAGASALVGVLIILAGVALAACFVISLTNMLMTLTTLKKGSGALLAKKGRIIAGIVFSAIAAVAFVVVLISTVVTNNMNAFVVAICVVMALLDVLSIVMKVKSLKMIHDSYIEE